MKLGVDKWKCPKCGSEIERDTNAAMHILLEGIRKLYAGEVIGAGISKKQTVVDTHRLFSIPNHIWLVLSGGSMVQ